MMAHVHLVQCLERQRSAEAPIEEWTWREDPPKLLECFVDTALEHRTTGQWRWRGSRGRPTAAFPPDGVPQNQRRCLLPRSVGAIVPTPGNRDSCARPGWPFRRWRDAYGRLLPHGRDPTR